MVTAFDQSLWGDEAFSAILSMKSIPDLIKIISHDTSPPLWNLFEWSAFRLFGTNEVIIRSLSLGFYLISAFFVFMTAWYLWNKKTAFWATALTLFNPFFFSYAFEGRMYSIMAAGVAASMYFFIKHKWVPYVIASLFALYTHHFAIFALAVQGIWFVYELIFKDKKVAISMFKSFVAIIIGYTPWFIPLYMQVKMVKGGFWLGVPTLVDLRNLVYDYLAEGIKSVPYNFAGYYIHQLALWISLAILILRKWTSKFKSTIFAFAWFTIPILLAWGISQKFTPVFYNRYLLYTIPAAMLILASGRRRFSWILIVLLIFVFVIIDFHYLFNPTKTPFRDLANYVKQTENKGDFIINEDAGNHKLWESKYYGIPAPIYNPIGTQLPYFVGTALMEPTDIINSLPDNATRLGVITYKDGKDLKIKNFINTSEKRFGNLNFVWMKKQN
jgi:hypothetical protein